VLSAEGCGPVDQFDYEALNRLYARARQVIHIAVFYGADSHEWRLESTVSALLRGFGKRQWGTAIQRASPEATGQPDQTQRYTLFLLPIWVLASVADYLWHRRTRIETTSGTEESITHSLMITEMAPAVLAALFLEVNAGVLTLIIASYLAHDATVAWGHLLHRESPAHSARRTAHAQLPAGRALLSSFVRCLHALGSAPVTIREGLATTALQHQSEATGPSAGILTSYLAGFGFTRGGTAC